MKNRRRNAGNGQNRSSIEPEQQQQTPRRTVTARGASSRVQGTSRPSTTPMRTYSTTQALDWPLGRELMTYPLDMLRRFRGDVDRFFEDLGNMRTGGSQPMTWAPRAEMFDRNGRTVVRVELPGLEKDDVKVSVWNDRLIIEGERRDEDEQQRRDYYQTEWSYGRFYREISLPEMVDSSEVMANFKNGVLEIELPQSQVSRQRRQVQIS